ncbi:MAG: DUF2851 family protein [Verrucomicrobia bacterium]|nr:DUF2851 family protein [Verrucomicrobiota bacterium]
MRLTPYAELRTRVLRESFSDASGRAVLRDADSNYVPISITERLVQAIWYDQRIQRENLATTDGCPLRVIFPGWWNVEAGPDFRHATVQFGDEPERKGDVEIHLRAGDWRQHRHDSDPRYNDVILHVVLWEAGADAISRTRAGMPVPQLALQHHLAAPLEALYDDIDLDSYPHGVRPHGGGCVNVMHQLAPLQVHSLLDHAGDERFANKTRKFIRWIHRAGPEQAFYEGWMEALGYKANKSAFRALAQRLPLALLAENRTVIAPLLFGVAGFLPTTASDDPFVKRLWKSWWKLRPDFEEKVLPDTAWRRAGIRPLNHPHRRLGAAAALLKKRPKLLENVLGSIESGGDPSKLFAQVRDEYWAQHCALGGKKQARPMELIGTLRAQQIVSNVVLPFLAACAEINSDPRLLEQVRARYTALPAGEPNTLLRLAGQQFFASDKEARTHLDTERRQQGMMQILLDFCVNDKSLCRNCRFPEMVACWRGQVRTPHAPREGEPGIGGSSRGA